MDGTNERLSQNGIASEYVFDCACEHHHHGRRFYADNEVDERIISKCSTYPVTHQLRGLQTVSMVQWHTMIYNMLEASWKLACGLLLLLYHRAQVRCGSERASKAQEHCRM